MSPPQEFGELMEVLNMAESLCAHIEDECEKYDFLQNETDGDSAARGGSPESMLDGSSRSSNSWDPLLQVSTRPEDRHPLPQG
jgi:hypothetical protein